MASKEKRQQRARQKRKQQNVARNRCSRLAVDHVVTFTGNDLGAIMEALPPPDYAGYDLLEPVIRVAVAKRETGGDGMPDEDMLGFYAGIPDFSVSQFYPSATRATRQE
ncbi:hypothetical protein [Siccibacter turicensis]|uniref:hypothetical protein n=1 Tax=Siccibacter turicensis TaxID=357233 RepID=UPI003F55B2E4